MYNLTEQNIEYIKSIAKGKRIDEITEIVNKNLNIDLTPMQIKRVKDKYHIKSGLDCTFKKGHTPANKGKKGSMNPEQYEKCKGTMFKKGNIPANCRPIGSERVDKRDGGTLVKVQNGHLQRNWMPKGRYIYEQTYGKIPEGYKVIFADGNNRNFEPDNLILVSNAEELIMNKNKLYSKNAEFTKTGVNIAKVLDKVNKRKQ